MRIASRIVLVGSILLSGMLPRIASSDEYEADFRDGRFDRDTLVPIGFQSLYGLQLLKPEPRGLRIVIPHHQSKNKPAVGFLPMLKVHGDFELSASYELLSVDPPQAGAGAGADLYILAEKSLHSASFRRCVTCEGEDAFFVHVTARDKNGKRRPQYRYFPAETKNGLMRLRRIGTTLQFLVAEGDGKECRKVHEADFGADTIGLVRIQTTTDGSPTTTETRWGHLAIRGDQLERVQIPLYQNRPAPDSALGTDPRRPLCLIDADGGNLRQLPFTKEYTTCGSPDWSRDGTKIAFDAWRTTKGESYVSAQIFVANADGSDPQHLGPGAMPSFSPNGKQIAFSCYDPRGVWTMNIDGSDRKLIDAVGWSARWCPNSNKIAYTVHDEGKANICVLDLAKEEQTLLLTGEHRRYAGIQINFDWSRDGKQIAFLGHAAENEHELVIVSVRGSKHGFKIRLRENTRLDLSWSPDGKTLLYPFPDRSAGGLQIYQLQIDSDEPPTRLEGQPQVRNNLSSAWSPDGKTILFVSGPAPK
ncbi:MAG: PD40 domain-containing protein [Planctomycetes bacterium]|nr:PD40 domain-containing protein [Planctomycetota bacterium]MBL7039477.1 PD40 domain-containing protein [Pirellulaceae bacterium]